jgi:methionine synthase II (cobalamin-independent)
MFATLLGALPKPPMIDADPLARILQLQEDAGLEPLTDGRFSSPRLVDLAAALDGIERSPAGALRVVALPRRSRAIAVDAWSAAASRTDRMVKQALPGPYTLLRQLDLGGNDEDAVLGAIADALHDEVVDLAAAGCPLVEIEETEAHRIGDDPVERARYRDAHLRLTAGSPATHLSLSIVGGSAHAAGVDTVLAAPYASLAVDLIAGPDNWNLVTRTPGDRGIIAGVIEPRDGSDDRPELPVWAANYAASTGRRSLARVGLGTAGSLAELSWPVAARKVHRLGEAARVAGMTPREQADVLDPRALDIRSAAMGRRADPARRARRRP